MDKSVPIQLTSPQESTTALAFIAWVKKQKGDLSGRP
jgi:ABC-type thiamine transport system substrate-binding protein